MLGRNHRAPLLGIIVAAGLTGAADLRADEPARVEYWRFGQGSSFVEIVRKAEVSRPAPSREADYWSRQSIRVIETGQARYIVPR